MIERRDTRRRVALVSQAALMAYAVAVTSTSCDSRCVNVQDSNDSRARDVSSSRLSTEELSQLVQRRPGAVVPYIENHGLRRAEMHAIGNAIEKHGVASHFSELAFLFSQWEFWSSDKNQYVEPEDATVQREALAAIFKSAKEIEDRRKVTFQIVVLAGRDHRYDQDKIFNMSDGELKRLAGEMLDVFKDEHETHPPSLPQPPNFRHRPPR